MSKLKSMTESSPRSLMAPSLSEGFFLPNFCGIRMVFAVVMVAELLAFILVLAGPWSGNGSGGSPSAAVRRGQREAVGQQLESIRVARPESSRGPAWPDPTLSISAPT